MVLSRRRSWYHEAVRLALICAVFHALLLPLSARMQFAQAMARAGLLVDLSASNCIPTLGGLPQSPPGGSDQDCPICSGLAGASAALTAAASQQTQWLRLHEPVHIADDPMVVERQVRPFSRGPPSIL